RGAHYDLRVARAGGRKMRLRGDLRLAATHGYVAGDPGRQRRVSIGHLRIGVPMPPPDELEDLLRKVPGATRVAASPQSKAFLQASRNRFRPLARFDTVSRLIEVGADEVDRSVSADSLGYFGRRATPFLARALAGDSSAQVRRHAAAALGLTGDPAAAGVLER